MSSGSEFLQVCFCFVADIYPHFYRYFTFKSMMTGDRRDGSIARQQNKQKATRRSFLAIKEKQT
jgi:hypothetical protein